MCDWNQLLHQPLAHGADCINTQSAWISRLSENDRHNYSFTQATQISKCDTNTISIPSTTRHTSLWSYPGLSYHIIIEGSWTGSQQCYQPCTSHTNTETTDWNLWQQKLLISPFTKTFSCSAWFNQNQDILCNSALHPCQPHWTLLRAEKNMRIVSLLLRSYFQLCIWSFPHLGHCHGWSDMTELKITGDSTMVRLSIE